MKGSEHRNKAVWSLCEVVRAEVSDFLWGFWGADEEDVLEEEMSVFVV